jgi:hypothetical protein
MARRPEIERVMTKQELEELRNNLLRLHASSVEGVYQTAHRDCAIVGNKFPPACAIQQLVCAWRVLRWMRKTSRIV